MKIESAWKCVVSALFVCIVLVGSTHYLASFAFYDEEGGVSDADEANAYMAAAVVASHAPRAHHVVASSTPQFVVLSFDGSKSIDMLNETLDFERSMSAKNKPIQFTYFINAVYFLTREHGDAYQAPMKRVGLSNIGYSNSENDVAKRVDAFNVAIHMGNEVASHSAGHFDGTDWDYAAWSQEFTSFDSLMKNVQVNNPNASVNNPLFLKVAGFRAPQLGVNSNLYKVESDDGFLYDASGVGGMENWPYKDDNALWHIPLGTIAIGEAKSPAVAMDYSLWMHQSGAEERAVKNTPLWDHYFSDVENAYMDYFNTNYNGDRAPIVIADHFSKWNDGVYWEAMKQFAENVCGQPQVRCTTFKELADYLNAQGTPQTLQ